MRPNLLWMIAFKARHLSAASEPQWTIQRNGGSLLSLQKLIINPIIYFTASLFQRKPRAAPILKVQNFLKPSSASLSGFDLLFSKQDASSSTCHLESVMRCQIMVVVTG